MVTALILMLIYTIALDNGSLTGEGLTAILNEVNINTTVLFLICDAVWLRLIIKK